MKHLVLTLTIAAAATGAMAEPPELQTPAPVIYLADNLDEVDRLGWCIDTVGRGLSDRLHAHSCKPQGGDVQFRFDETSGQIQSVAFADLCAQYDGTVPLGLVTCDGGPAQQFSYDLAEQTIHPAGDASQCLSVGESSQSAGPFLSRSLEMLDCDTVPAARKAWIILP